MMNTDQELMQLRRTVYRLKHTLVVLAVVGASACVLGASMPQEPKELVTQKLTIVTADGKVAANIAADTTGEGITVSQPQGDGVVAIMFRFGGAQLETRCKEKFSVQQVAIPSFGALFVEDSTRGHYRVNIVAGAKPGEGGATAGISLLDRNGNHAWGRDAK